jgi:hypothetical protein
VAAPLAADDREPPAIAAEIDPLGVNVGDALPIEGTGACDGNDTLAVATGVVVMDALEATACVEGETLVVPVGDTDALEDPVCVAEELADPLNVPLIVPLTVPLDVPLDVMLGVELIVPLDDTLIVPLTVALAVALAVGLGD